MENSINQSPNQKKLEDLINEENLIIFDEKNWIGKDLWKISEVTYSYDEKTKINTTLFVVWWELNLEEYKNADRVTKQLLILHAQKTLEKRLHDKKAQIKSALQEVELLWILTQDQIEIDKRSIFVNSLNEKNDFLDYCLNAIQFEIEKAWFISTLNTEEELQIENKQKELDTKLFWWNIKDKPEEVILAYEYIIEKYIKNKGKLTIEQQERFEWYLNKVKPYLPIWYIHIAKIKPKIIEWDFLDLDISKPDYILSFNILVEALEKLEHVVESNKDVKSISDWPRWVQFPTTEKFDNMKMLRFFKLGSHEIETHNITDYNWKQLIGNMRGAFSTEKDEWVAMLMEQLFMYWNELYKTDEFWNQIIDINKVQINSYFTKTLMWELLHDDVELKDFLEISEIIDPDVISPLDRFNRLKRNNKRWVQHKDTTYTRWLFKAIEEINKFIVSKWKQWINPEDMFLGKISFSETEKLKRIKQTKEAKWDTVEIIRPLFISDAIYFIINEKLKWEEWNITGESFYKYLQEKYPIFDFSREQISQVSHQTKRNVYWIVNIMLKNIDENNIKKIDKNNKWAVNSIHNKSKFWIEPIKNKMQPNRKNAK